MMPVQLSGARMVVRPSALIACGVLLLAWAGHAFSGTLACDGNFDNGRIKVDSIHQAQRILWTSIPPNNHTQSSFMRYWHSRVSGIRPGEMVTINHRGTTEEMQYVYSYDGENWFRFPEIGISNKKHRFVAPSVEISPNIAYPYGHSLVLCAKNAGKPSVTVSNLATSEEGREIKLLRITDPLVPDSGKRLVWVQGRQHAFESSSSYPVEGLACWLASDDSAAREFRRNTITYLAPIMDVDNVYRGMTGKDQPNDFNRVWNLASPPWRAVAAAKAMLDTLCIRHSLMAFIDCHQPTYLNRPHWYVASNPGNWNKFRLSFLEGVTEAGKANLNRMSVVEWDTIGGDTTGSQSRNYVFGKWGSAPDYIGCTMESAHYLDDAGIPMIKEGYLQWGEALGRGLYKYMGGLKKTADIPPKAILTLAKIDSTGYCELDGGQSTDADGTILKYQWSFGDGTNDTTGGPKTSHTYGALGYYPVQLRVSDDKGISGPPASVTVKIDSLRVPAASDLSPAMEKVRLSASPNPFNSAVHISLGGSGPKTSLSIVDVTGREVKKLGGASAGPLQSVDHGTIHQAWNGLDEAGKPVSSGFYMVKAAIGRRILIKRVLCVR